MYGPCGAVPYLPDHLEAIAMHVYATTQSKNTGGPFLRTLARSMITLVTVLAICFSTHRAEATLIEKNGVVGKMCT